MEKNPNFYDPYNFNNSNVTPAPQAIDPTLDPMIANPMMYYDQQYMYYRYLTQVLEYKIKLKEYENLEKK